MTATDENVKDEQFAFLDELRLSGETNMFGARPYLQLAFPELSDAEARTILADWMRSK